MLLQLINTLDEFIVYPFRLVHKLIVRFDNLEPIDKQFKNDKIGAMKPDLSSLMLMPGATGHEYGRGGNSLVERPFHSMNRGAGGSSKGDFSFTRD
jgi:hypothetical protein